LQCKYTGGTVFHTFVGEKMTVDSVKKMVKKISSNYHLPYFTISPTFSVCPVHGYLSGEHEYCPKCDLEIAEGEAHAAAVKDVVVAEVSDAEIAVAENVEVEKPDSVNGVPSDLGTVPSVPLEGKVPSLSGKLIAPTITVKGDTITVVEASSGHDSGEPGSDSELNFGGDTNGEN